jgi:hypothetical protein
MRLARFATPLTFAIVFGSRSALAQDGNYTASHREAVRQLMEVTHVKELIEQSGDAMLKGQLQQMPQLAPYANVLKDFYHEQMSWTALEPEYTRLYLELFSEPEVRELITFYQSPLGQKLLVKMPVLMTKSSELATRRIQAAMPQLMQRMQEAMQNPGATRVDSAPPKKKP